VFSSTSGADTSTGGTWSDDTNQTTDAAGSSVKSGATAPADNRWKSVAVELTIVES
jgi:hypothetical protein